MYVLFFVHRLNFSNVTNQLPGTKHSADPISEGTHSDVRAHGRLFGSWEPKTVWSNDIYTKKEKINARIVS